ncbi:MAG: hypothetical protein J6J61_03970, partial [Muribaculaceae bacterium]|nr:hypothetical protein [Muribaculaceae bacterium]
LISSRKQTTADLQIILLTLARISKGQESARINAFHYVCSPPSYPQPGLPDGLRCKFTKKYKTEQLDVEKV